MKYLVAIWVIIVLLGLLLISLVNMSEYGVSGLILAGISAFALYRIFKCVFEGGDSDDVIEYNASGSGRPNRRSDPLEYIFFSDISGDDHSGD